MHDRDDPSARGPLAPPRTWRLKSVTLACRDELPLLMGIVNVTPDSFSDGGKFLATDRALQHALQLVVEGADIIDIGGESTRPYAEPISADEQIERVLPVIEQLRNRVETPISIDTRSAVVARAAIAAGAEVINDVSGLAGDPEMLATAVEAQVGVCAMHMQGTPKTMQDDPRYEHVVDDIAHYLAARRDALRDAGIDRHRICLDPGIGFGKTHAHNLELMQSCWQFHRLGHPLLVGHSRKGFLAKILGDPDRDRTAVTAGAAVALAAQGIQVLRVHDVGPVRETLLAWATCRARESGPSPGASSC
jgi:dihydropteroate synthase